MNASVMTFLVAVPSQLSSCRQSRQSSYMLIKKIKFIEFQINANYALLTPLSSLQIYFLTLNLHFNMYFITIWHCRIHDINKNAERNCVMFDCLGGEVSVYTIADECLNSL